MKYAKILQIGEYWYSRMYQAIGDNFQDHIFLGYDKSLSCKEARWRLIHQFGISPQNITFNQ